MDLDVHFAYNAEVLGEKGTFVRLREGIPVWLGLQMNYELDTRSDIIGGKLENEVKVCDKLAVA